MTLYCNDKKFPQPLVHVMRGKLVESIHRGHMVAARGDGSVAFSLGDAGFPTYLRSAAKPFQAIPVVEEGAADLFKLTDAELAVMCGSVSGQSFHVDAVRSILEKAGMDESFLECGVHHPSHRGTWRQMQERGEQARPIHNNCAGKHAAMLVLCAVKHYDVKGYSSPEHPVQQLVGKYVAELCNMRAYELGVGVDGCGVPVFRAPLVNIATGYARLAAPETAGGSKDRVHSINKIMNAALAHPEMIAGDERVCTETMRRKRGRFLAKTGAEASYGLSLVQEKLGIAFKVEDGSMRALSPVVVEVLAQMGILDNDDVENLSGFHKPQTMNHCKDVVGSLLPVFNLEGLDRG